MKQKATEAVAITTFGVLNYSYKLVKKKEWYYMYVNHSFLFLIRSESIKDSDYNNLIIFLGMVNKFNSLWTENDLNLNNDKGNNDNNNDQNKNSIKENEIKF